MKKILIPALLVVSAAFAPYLRSTADFPDRACEMARGVASPLFWHLWDEVVVRELAHQAGSKAQLGRGAESWGDHLGCVLLQVFVKQAFERLPSAEYKGDCLVTSIPLQLIRQEAQALI